MWRPGSSVGIATDYGLDGPGIESRWGRDFPPVQTGPGAHPASCTMGTGSFPGVKCGRGVLLTTHPLLAPRSWKDRAIPLPPLWATNRPVTGLLYFTYSRVRICPWHVSALPGHPNFGRYTVRIHCKAIQTYLISWAFVAIYLLSSGFPA